MNQEQVRRILAKSEAEGASPAELEIQRQYLYSQFLADKEREYDRPGDPPDEEKDCRNCKGVGRITVPPSPYCSYEHETTCVACKGTGKRSGTSTRQDPAEYWISSAGDIEPCLRRDILPEGEPSYTEERSIEEEAEDLLPEYDPDAPEEERLKVLELRLAAVRKRKIENPCSYEQGGKDELLFLRSRQQKGSLTKEWIEQERQELETLQEHTGLIKDYAQGALDALETFLSYSRATQKEF